MRNALFGLSLVGLLAACSSSKADTVVSDKNTAKEIVSALIPNRMLTVDIDGMVCQMGCGGSIRKELSETNAVGQCSFDFEEGRETNIATIEFDKDLITADEISKIISEINDGQFIISESNASAVESREDTSNAPKSSENTSEELRSVNMTSTSVYELPNLLEIFSNLLIH